MSEKCKCSRCGYVWVRGADGSHRCVEILSGAAKSLKTENRELKKHLKELTKTVKVCVRALDSEMKKPSDYERGKRVALICNELELANNISLRFGLRQGKG